MVSATRSVSTTSYPGFAAEDIATDSIVLKVICNELLPGALSGTLAAGITKANVNLKDRDGNAISSTITTANHIVATWEGKSNTRYPPMIRKGEPVEVYKIADQDKFYWRETGRGRTFRTTDRVHMEIGATDPTKPGVDKNDTNTYSAYLDSHNQVVGMKTSKANGEAVAFAMEANTKTGTFHLTDDTSGAGGASNCIVLDTGTVSGTPMFQVNLSTGLTMKFNGQDLLIQVPGKTILSSKDRIVFESPIVVLNTSTSGSVIVNATNIALNAATDVIITAGNVFGVNAAASKIAGALVAGITRLVTAGKGALGGSYSPITISNVESGSVSSASNTPDTSPGSVVF